MAVDGPVRIDLEERVAAFDGKEVPFALDDTWRVKLLNGWDDIDLTQQHRGQIAAFAENYAQTAPWAHPTAPD